MYKRTIEEYMQDRREKRLIDMRKPEDFAQETCPGAENLFYEPFGDEVPEFPKDKPIYLLCYTGSRSDEWAEELEQRGCEAYSIQGGFVEYLRIHLNEMMGRLEQEQLDTDTICKDVERSIVKKFRKDIWRKFTQVSMNMR